VREQAPLRAWAPLRRIARAVGFDIELSRVQAMAREDRRSLHLNRKIADRVRHDPKAIITVARSDLARMRDSTRAPSTSSTNVQLPGDPLDDLAHG